MATASAAGPVGAPRLPARGFGAAVIACTLPVALPVALTLLVLVLAGAGCGSEPKAVPLTAASSLTGRMEVVGAIKELCSEPWNSDLGCGVSFALDPKSYRDAPLAGAGEALEAGGWTLGAKGEGWLTAGKGRYCITVADPGKIERIAHTWGLDPAGFLRSQYGVTGGLAEARERSLVTVDLTIDGCAFWI